MAVVPSEGETLDQVVDRLLATRERIMIVRDDVAIAAVVSTRDLDGLDRSVEILSEPKVVRRIIESETAIQQGSLLMGEELAALDPDAMFVARSVAGGAALAASMRSGGGQRWDLVAGMAARDSLNDLPGHVAHAVRRFVFGPLLDNPAAAGVELPRLPQPAVRHEDRDDPRHLPSRLGEAGRPAHRGLARRGDGRGPGRRQAALVNESQDRMGGMGR